MNALIDSMIHGGINAVEPPYILRFTETSGRPDDVIGELRFARQGIADARLEQRNATGIDADVDFQVV